MSKILRTNYRNGIIIPFLTVMIWWNQCFFFSFPLQQHILVCTWFLNVSYLLSLNSEYRRNTKNKNKKRMYLFFVRRFNRLKVSSIKLKRRLTVHSVHRCWSYIDSMRWSSSNRSVMSVRVKNYKHSMTTFIAVK